MSFENITWLIDAEKTTEAQRPSGLIDGIELANILIANGELEPELDYVPVQTTMVDDRPHTLGITSEGSFRWFPDVAFMGEMDTVYPAAEENAEALFAAMGRGSESQIGTGLKP